MDSELQINSDDRVDLDMVMGLIGNALLDEDGVDQITGIMQQALEPSDALANVAFQLVSTTIDQLLEEDLEVSSTIWAARGGVVDQTLAEIAQLVMGVGGGRVSPEELESARDEVLSMLNQQMVPLEEEEMAVGGGLLSGMGGMPDMPMPQEGMPPMAEEQAMMGLLGG